MELPAFRDVRPRPRARGVELATAPPLPSTDGRRRGRHRPALQHAGLARDRRPSRSSWTAPSRWRRRTRGARGCSAAWTTPGRPAHRLAARDRVLRSRAARLRPLRVRPRGHAGPPGRPHRPRRLPRLHEQPADRGDLRRRAERPLQGDRRLARAADPDVEHGVRRGDRDPRQILARRRARLLPGRPPHPLDRREPGELPDLGAQGLRDPERPARAGSTATAASRPTRATT